MIFAAELAKTSFFLLGVTLEFDFRVIGIPRLIDWQSATNCKCKR